MPDERADKKFLTASPLEKWMRPPGCPRTTWLKPSILQDLKSDSLSLHKAVDMAQNHLQYSGDWCRCLALHSQWCMPDKM